MAVGSGRRKAVRTLRVSSPLGPFCLRVQRFAVMPDVAVVGSPAALASRRAAIQRKSQREAFAANERERWLRDQMTATDDVARQQQYKAKQATATTAALRRFKKEAAADRSAFDAEVRRKEAAFARVEEDRRQREAERLREAGRAAASFAEYSRRRGGGAAAPAVRLSARDERRLRDAFEAEWSKFESAPRARRSSTICRGRTAAYRSPASSRATRSRRRRRG